jgi:hypothetical protein
MLSDDISQPPQCESHSGRAYLISLIAALRTTYPVRALGQGSEPTDSDRITIRYGHWSRRSTKPSGASVTPLNQVKTASTRSKAGSNKKIDIAISTQADGFRHRGTFGKSGESNSERSPY